MTVGTSMTDQEFDIIRRLLLERSAIALEPDKQYLVETRLAPLVRQRKLNSLGELIARAMHDNLNRFIVPNLAGPVRLVPLAALVTRDLSLNALRQAAQRGRLNAVQGPDGVWRSSRRAVDDYRATKHKRRPAPS